MRWSLLEKITIFLVIVGLSISITNMNFIIAEYVCDFIGIRHFTYFSFIYWCDITINIFGLILVILDIIFAFGFYKLLEHSYYDLI